MTDRARLLAGPLEGHIIASQVRARAAVLQGETDEGLVHIPAVVLELGKEGAPPELWTKVAIVGEPQVLRQVARLIRDAANTAALRAEQAAR